MPTHYTLPKETISTSAANSGNQITKKYYDFLVGEINRGTIKKALCSIHYPRFNYTTYHLISL